MSPEPIPGQTYHERLTEESAWEDLRESQPPATRHSNGYISDNTPASQIKPIKTETGPQCRHHRSRSPYSSSASSSSRPAPQHRSRRASRRRRHRRSRPVSHPSQYHQRSRSPYSQGHMSHSTRSSSRRFRHPSSACGEYQTPSFPSGGVPPLGTFPFGVYPSGAVPRPFSPGPVPHSAYSWPAAPRSSGDVPSGPFPLGSMPPLARPLFNNPSGVDPAKPGFDNLVRLRAHPLYDLKYSDGQNAHFIARKERKAQKSAEKEAFIHKLEHDIARLRRENADLKAELRVLKGEEEPIVKVKEEPDA